MIVIIDYDQKIRSINNGEEWQVLQRAVEDLEEVAKLCKCPIVILAQGREAASKSGIAGDPKASARTKQSASAVIRLHKENDAYFIELMKNRFGPREGKLDINFNSSTMKMTEGDWQRNEVVVEQVKKTKGAFS